MSELLSYKRRRLLWLITSKSGNSLRSLLNKSSISAEQVEWLQNIGCQVGAKIHKSSNQGLAATADQGFLHSIDVAGSGLHQGVLRIEKVIGFKDLNHGKQWVLPKILVTQPCF